jgi:hypothetical protein
VTSLPLSLPSKYPRERCMLDADRWCFPELDPSRKCTRAKVADSPTCTSECHSQSLQSFPSFFFVMAKHDGHHGEPWPSPLRVPSLVIRSISVSCYIICIRFSRSYPQSGTCLPLSASIHCLSCFVRALHVSSIGDFEQLESKVKKGKATSASQSRLEPEIIHTRGPRYGRLAEPSYEGALLRAAFPPPRYDWVISLADSHICGALIFPSSPCMWQKQIHLSAGQNPSGASHVLRPRNHSSLRHKSRSEELLHVASTDSRSSWLVIIRSTSTLLCLA